MATNSFPTTVTEKLDESNYLHQRQFVEPVIKSHKLQLFVVNPIDVINPAYEA